MHEEMKKAINELSGMENGIKELMMKVMLGSKENEFGRSYQ